MGIKCSIAKAYYKMSAWISNAGVLKHCRETAFSRTEIMEIACLKSAALKNIAGASFQMVFLAIVFHNVTVRLVGWDWDRNSQWK